MQRVVLDIPDNKFSSFLKLLKNLGIEKIERLSPQQVEYVDGVKSALNEVQEHLEGENYLQNAKDFLEEL